jgi:hypothetical protein
MLFVVCCLLGGCFSIDDKLGFLNQDKAESFIVELELRDSPITCHGIVISNTEILFMDQCPEIETDANGGVVFDNDIVSVRGVKDVLVGDSFEPDLLLYSLNGKTNIRILDVKGFDKHQQTVKVSRNIVKNGDPITIMGLGCRDTFYSRKAVWDDSGMVVKWCSIYPGDAILNQAGELVGVVSEIDFGIVPEQGMEKVNFEKIVW